MNIIQLAPEKRYEGKKLGLLKVNLRNNLADKDVNQKREALKRMKMINKLEPFFKR